MTVLCESTPNDSGSFRGSRQAGPSVRDEVRRASACWAPKALLHGHKDAVLRRFTGAHSRRGAHVADAIGGDRNAAILRIIAANNCRGIATSAIWNLT